MGPGLASRSTTTAARSISPRTWSTATRPSRSPSSHITKAAALALWPSGVIARMPAIERSSRDNDRSALSRPGDRGGLGHPSASASHLAPRTRQDAIRTASGCPGASCATGSSMRMRRASRPAITGERRVGRRVLNVASPDAIDPCPGSPGAAVRAPSTPARWTEAVPLGPGARSRPGSTAHTIIWRPSDFRPACLGPGDLSNRLHVYLQQDFEGAPSACTDHNGSWKVSGNDCAKPRSN